MGIVVVMDYWNPNDVECGSGGRSGGGERIELEKVKRKGIYI